MNKNIGFNFKYNTDFIQRAQDIKDIGFDGIFLYAHHEPQESVDAARKVGLEVETLHLPYKEIEAGKTIKPGLANILWNESVNRESYKKLLLSYVEFAHENKIGALVMHITFGDNPPAFSDSGVRFITDIVQECEKNNIVLCLENLRRLDYIENVLTSVDSKFLKFCFDVGHANCMTKNLNSFPWETFGKYLYCLHISDNDGISDKHLIPFLGNVDWKRTITTIFKYSSNINLTLEVHATNEQRQTLTEKQFLCLCFESLCKIEQLINE